MAADEGKGREKFIVGGYEFLSENDAQKASMDLSKINLLEARVKASRPADIKAVYEKSMRLSQVPQCLIPEGCYHYCYHSVYG